MTRQCLIATDVATGHISIIPAEPVGSQTGLKTLEQMAPAWARVQGWVLIDQDGLSKITGHNGFVGFGWLIGDWIYAWSEVAKGEVVYRREDHFSVLRILGREWRHRSPPAILGWPEPEDEEWW